MIKNIKIQNLIDKKCKNFKIKSEKMTDFEN